MKSFLLSILVLVATNSISQKSDPYKLIAYYTGSGKDISKYPVSKLTHIIYSFLQVKNDSLSFRNSNQQESLQQLVALKKQYPKLKIMVSVGGWGGCSYCSEMFESPERRLRFAKTTADLFKKFGIDGLDLDWEYPSIEGYPGHRYTAGDKDNFTELVKVLRQELGEKYLVTFAAGGFEEFLEKSIDWPAITPLVDFINLMTYDLVSGFSTVTGHHTPTFDYRPGQQSTAKCVNWLIRKGVPSNKLIIGAATYARVWEQVENIDNGLFQPGKFKTSISYTKFKSYFADTTGFKYYWDDQSKAGYRYNASKKLFATFDDPESIKAKTDFIKAKKLGGIMFWELREDAPVGGLTEEMAKGLQ